MPATKSKPSDERANGRSPRVRVRSLATAKAQTDGADTAEVAVRKDSFKTLQRHKGAMRKVLTTYADVVAKAERLGRPVELIIRVRPDEPDSFVEERAADGDRLDKALAAARQRGAARVAEILRAPEMISARDFGQVIGASHETVNQKRKAGELLGLAGAKRGLRYPTWQVTDDGRPLPGLADLTRTLGGEPWTVYRFLVQPHGELGGRTGLDALKANRVEEALAAARGIGEGAFA